MDIIKENWHNFSKLPKNVIIDLYILCFQNYCASLITSITSWCERGGGAKPAI